MAQGKMTAASKLQVLVVLLSACFRVNMAQANYCNVNGVTHQVGESWTTATGNNRLKKCTCTRRGQWNCAYAKEDALMFVADVNGIGKIKISDAAGFKDSFIRDLSGRTVAVDVDIESDAVYWTDVSFKGRGIYKATFSSGHDVRRFITDGVYEPNGIAVDWLAKNIYWTDAQMRAIYVAKENGQHKAMIVGGLSEPRGIVVLPLHGIMFWSDQEDGSIETATMDGNNRKVVIAGLGWPNEIAVDVTRNKLYWIDGKKRTIESCNFDGTNWKKILDFAITFDSSGYGLSLFGGRLYFTVWREKAVYSVTVLGQDLRVVVENMNENLAGLAIVNTKMQQAPISNSVGACRRHRSPCSHICLPRSRGGYTCACPEKSGTVLSQDLHTCKVPQEFLLFTSIYDGSIMVVSREFGTKPHPVLLTYASQPSAIDYDPSGKMIYWSDVAKNGIYRMRLNGTGYDVFLEDGIGIVDGMAIDWVGRYLYFTNYGWEAHSKQFARIEMVSLDGSKRKVLVHQGLDKPRDIVIDLQRGFLYYSDWGIESKVVRLDLDGKNPHIVPVDVENPNGLALDNAVLYVTDSHRKSSLVEINGTVIYGRPPSLIKYDTALDRLEENMDLNLEIPFGITMDKHSLYVTDWGLLTISEIDVSTGILRTIASGVSKATGIVRASLNAKEKFVNECMKGKKCSHICVPVDQVYSSCICPDHTGKALSEDSANCVAPDQFILVADVNKIIMTSESPNDPSTYLVVRTFDDYSNIVAFAYDPVTRFVYWADNGRQRICRKTLASPFGSDGGTTRDIEVIYSEIENVEGMVLDSENRLLYWTDGSLGTIEVLDLSGMIHATVLEYLVAPRAIALDPSVGVMYWTEWGRAAMLMTAKMNGGDPRPLITTNLKWPNGLLYDAGEDKIFIADGGTLEIKSISADAKFDHTTSIDAMNYYDLNGTVNHIFGVAKLGSQLLFTDWDSRSLYKIGRLESTILITNLTRPTQVYAHTSTTAPEVRSQCSTAMHDCSHICVPSAGSYKCLCPDHLVLANNLKNCVRPENLHLYTTTLEPPIVIEEEETTMAWAEGFYTEPIAIEERTLKLERLPDPTTPQPNTTVKAVTVAIRTTPIVPETTTTVQTTTTTLPPPPRFPFCKGLRLNETAEFTVFVPEDDGSIELSAKLLELRALDVNDKDLNVVLVDEGYSRVYPGTYVVAFSATDRFNRTIFCNTTVVVKDVTPPRVLYCPGDLDIEAYDDGKKTIVSWMEPKFEDNSGTAPMIMQTNYPGEEFVDGIHKVEYTAYDDPGNSAVCTFMVVLMHRNARCGSPWVPPNSYIMCHSDTVSGDQVCVIACLKGYSLSLKTPVIRCRLDLQAYSIDWLPFLDANVCKKPDIGNPQQVVTLQYMCPCRPTPAYYEATYQIITGQLREAIDCNTRQHSLGLCINAERKLFLECVNSSTVELEIKVDLASLEQVPDYAEARRIVKRSVTEILDKAVGGKIQARGSDMRKYSANEEASLSDINILCKRGFKAVEDGCVECPRGTYWHESDCEFCPLHSFQEKSGATRCVECAEATGTRHVGSTHRSHCVKMVRREEIGKPNVIIIVSAVVGGIVFIAIIASIFTACWYRRRKIKQVEKQEAAERRRRRSRRRRNSTGSNRSNPEMLAAHAMPIDVAAVASGPQVRTVSRELAADGDMHSEFSDGRMSRRSGSSGKRVTIKEEAIEHRIPTADESPPQKGSRPTERNWRMALMMRNTTGAKKSKRKSLMPSPRGLRGTEEAVVDDMNARDSAPDVTTDAEEDKSQASATQSETETEKTLTDGQTTDTEAARTDTEASIPPTDSDVSTVRGSRRLMSSTSDLGDETLSMTSGMSSRATTPIKGVLKKPRRIVSMDDSATFTDSTRTNTLQNARLTGDSRGRDTLRQSMRNNGGRSISQDQGTKRPVGIRRSLSFDRGPTGVGRGQRMMFDRDLRFRGMPHHRPNAPGMALRPPAPQMLPPGARPRFLPGPRIRGMPPPGAIVYRHPNHPNLRMTLVPMHRAARPMIPGRMPAPPPYGYDDSSDWETASQGGSEMDMRKPPRHMMLRPGMMPGYAPRPVYTRMRMPGGGMMMPHPRYPPGFGGPRQPHFQPRPGFEPDR